MGMQENRGRKRKKCQSSMEEKWAIAAEDGISVSGISRLISNVWDSQDLVSRRGYEFYSELRECSTNYGDLIQTITIPLEDGTCYEGSYINPMALMSHATGSCAKYGNFLQLCFNGRVGKLCFHIDAAELGTMIAPSPGREFQSVSYTFAELPSWYRARDTGYIPFGILPANVVDGKNMSSTFRVILDIFSVSVDSTWKHWEYVSK